MNATRRQTQGWERSLRAQWAADPPAGAGPSGDPLAATEIVDVCCLPADDGIARALAVATDRRHHLLLVPAVRAAGRWRRAVPGDGVAAALLTAFTSGLPGSAEFRLTALALPPQGRGEREVKADQTNESVVVDESTVVKWIRRPSVQPHPAPGLFAHLAEVGFDAIPRAYGSLLWRPAGSSGCLLALVHAFLPGARDGWEWRVELLLRHLAHLDGDCAGGCDADFAAEAGRLTGRLHVALATPSSVFPDPIGWAGREQIRGWLRAARTGLADALTSDQDRGLATIAPEIEARLALLAQVDRTPVIRIHGDLHIGQLLPWRDGLAVIDFDGNPVTDPSTRATPQPAARDVAQMLSSLDHIGRVAGLRAEVSRRPAIEAWISRSQRLFLTGYRTELAAAGFQQLLDERLLASFAVEQECRELVYAARYLPSWRYAPMATLGRLLSAAPAPPLP